MEDLLTFLKLDSPFHLATDAQGMVISAGPALRKLAPEIVTGRPWRDLLWEMYLDSPYKSATSSKYRIANLSFDFLGKTYYLPTSRIEIRVLIPALTSMAQLSGTGLSFRDFNEHDQMLNYLVLLQSMSLTLEETRKLSIYMQERLNAEKVNLASMIGRSPHPFLQITLQGGLTFANPASAPLLAKWGAQIESKVSEGLFAQIQESLRNGNDLEVEAAERIFSLGIFRELVDSKMIFAFGHDITETVRSRRAVSFLLEKFSHANRLAVYGELAAGIAHEVNTPLTALVCRAADLSQGVESGSLSPGQASDLAAQIESIAMQISQLVKSTSSIVKLRPNESIEKVEVRKLVDDVVSLCQDQFRLQSIRLEVGLMPQSLEIECRPIEVAQVLANLLANARDAVMGSADRWVSIDCEEEADSVRFSISDSGPGVPATISEKLMDAFFTTKPPSEGAGLGLSIAKKSVDGHSGSIFLDSSAAHTKFCVILPKSSPSHTVVFEDGVTREF